MEIVKIKNGEGTVLEKVVIGNIQIDTANEAISMTGQRKVMRLDGEEVTANLHEVIQVNPQTSLPGGENIPLTQAEYLQIKGKVDALKETITTIYNTKAQVTA